MIPSLEKPVPKSYRRGTHRTVEPAETFGRLSRLLPVMGITRIANITGLDRIGIPVFSAYRPNARSIVVSQGKGLDVQAARTSALMESVELYHAERITLPLKYCSFIDLQCRQRIVSIRSLPILSVNIFHRDLNLLWIEGQDILQGKSVWLPYELVHMNLSLPLPPGSGCFPISSNGLASGNHVLEATSHAICELVERDAFTLWSLNGSSAKEETRVAVDTVTDPDCRKAIAAFERAGIVVGVWDLTSDIGLPVFRCSIVDRQVRKLRQLYANSGMGCHNNREIALLRALTEAAQSRLTLISGARDDLSRGLYSGAKNSDSLNRVLRRICAETPKRRFTDVPTHPSDSFDADIRQQLTLLESAGLSSVIAIDLTDPVLQIPVVRVVIPGLESNREFPGYTPGRRASSVLKNCA